MTHSDDLNGNIEQFVESKLGDAKAARNQKRFDQAMQLLLPTVDRCRQQPDEMLLAKALNALAQIQRDTHDYSSSLSSYQEMLEIYQRQQSEAGCAHAYRHIADIHRHSNNPQAALEGYQKALAIYRELSGEQSLPYTNTLRGMARLYTQQKDRDTAIQHWQLVKQLYADLGITAGVEECDLWLSHLNHTPKHS